MPSHGTITSHSFEPVNEPRDSARENALVEQSKNQINTRQKMSLGWQPDIPTLITRAKMAGLQVDLFTPEVIGMFKIHFEAQEQYLTNSQWLAKLVAWVKREQAHLATRPTVKNQVAQVNPTDDDDSWLDDVRIEVMP
ncbi:DnaT-like ssDNA-binding domain-containing protein [Pseudomonas sp. F1_0610]|uniref:DnaT-like ssDNA-binding domain-containing protein n=1 Tax=Pseudomonas sp. F1_0610 TaxID=3114284 RepID=UPI0039C2D1EB